jgi:hypothetical protein
MAPSKQESKGKKGKGDAAQHDPTRALAYILRGSKGPETRSARLEDNRVDYFRGKDLFRLLRAQPELIDEYAPQLTGVPTPTDPSAREREVGLHSAPRGGADGSHGPHRLRNRGNRCRSYGGHTGCRQVVFWLALPGGCQIGYPLGPTGCHQLGVF